MGFSESNKHRQHHVSKALAFQKHMKMHFRDSGPEVRILKMAQNDKIAEFSSLTESLLLRAGLNTIDLVHIIRLCSEKSQML